MYPVGGGIGPPQGTELTFSCIWPLFLNYRLDIFLQFYSIIYNICVIKTCVGLTRHDGYDEKVSVILRLVPSSMAGMMPVQQQQQQGFPIVQVMQPNMQGIMGMNFGAQMPTAMPIQVSFWGILTSSVIYPQYKVSCAKCKVSFSFLSIRMSRHFWNVVNILNVTEHCTISPVWSLQLHESFL